MTPDDLISEIRHDRRRGASELACCCLAGLAEYARTAGASDSETLRAELVDLAGRLRDSRPTMAPITNLLDQWLALLNKPTEQKLDDFRAQVSQHTNALIQASKAALSQAVANAVALIGSDKTIVTHSLSSTVLAVFETLAPRVKAIVTESRPPGEGRRLTEMLSALAVETHFITDQQMGVFTRRADIALVGADTVADDGSVINKAGTYLLALAAKDQGIPFYVCFESFKCATSGVSQVPLEAHDPTEFDAPSLEHVKSHNVYFDVTPPRLVSAWITERGVQQDAAALAPRLTKLKSR